jgi:3D (Asp-Asp-Asp) domain-containing protein
MGRGLPLTIAILWIGSLAAYTVARTDAGADTAPRQANLIRRQPHAGSLLAAAATNVGREQRPQAPVGAALSRVRLLPAFVQASPRAIPTKPAQADTPPKPARQHEQGTTHRMKAPVRSRPAVTAGPTHTLQVWVTGYDLYGVTATGVSAGPGICAVDPTTIPLGTHIAIAGVGTCVAADTGPAVVGAHIDVWVPDYQSAVNLTGMYTASW